MTIKWLLILWLYQGANPVVIQAEFRTKDLCQYAKQDIVRQFMATPSRLFGNGMYVVGDCYANGLGVK